MDKKKPVIKKTSDKPVLKGLDETAIKISDKSSPDKKFYERLFSFFYKHVFSIAALIISYLAYNLNSSTSATQHRLYTKQERQWNAINMARIAIVDAHFFTFRTVTREQMMNDTLFGIQSPSDKDNSPNLFMIKYLLNGFDSVEHKNIMSSSVSMKDFIKEMNDKKIDSRRKMIVKLFSPIITIKNVGQTTCTIDSIVIHNLVVNQLDSNYYANINNEPSHNIGRYNFSLEPGQEFINTSFTINAALGTQNPKMRFQYDIYYRNFIGDTLSEKLLVNTSDGGFWWEELYNSAKVNVRNTDNN